VPIIRSEFSAAWWLPGAHAQTLWPGLFRRRILPPITRERVELEDGDFIDLIWAGPVQGPIVLFLHGLEGGLRSHYVGGIMCQLVRQGFRVCLMLFRGCGEQPNRLPISYHSGKTDDPQRILEHIQTNRRQEVYAAVGVSLGGNVLLKWLGEQGVRTPLKRAVALSVPFLLDDAARRLQQGLSRFYQRHLIASLQARHREKFSHIPVPFPVEIDRLSTFYAFDDRITAPLHGFAGVDDYYRRCSSRQFIPAIRVPTLILHARNDPFMFPDTPPSERELPDNVWLELTEQGGHVGFIQGLLPGRADYWAEKRIASWLAE
jgi:predicted alpha/beta-fold hydrolase